MRSFDVETFLIRPGLLAPPLVCSSWADEKSEHVLDRTDSLTWIRKMLLSSEHLVGTNIAFDFGVVAAAEPALLPLIFAAYEAGRIHDISIREALNAIAEGGLFIDPRTGEKMRDPESGKPSNRYSLAICCDLVLNRKIEKKDTWRLRYGELSNIPMSEWPEDARQYPKSDARNTFDVAKAQEGYRNLQIEPEECQAAFALHLASVWGMRTDLARVGELANRVTDLRNRARTRFAEVGIYRSGINPKTQKPWPKSKAGTRDTAALRARITEAYKGDPPLTSQGAVSADRLTMSDSGDEVLEEYAAAGQNETVYNTFLEVIERGVEVPINPRYGLAESLRTTCADPNLQQIPR